MRELTQLPLFVDHLPEQALPQFNLSPRRDLRTQIAHYQRSGRFIGSTVHTG